jgi:hypothetical protein
MEFVKVIGRNRQGQYVEKSLPKKFVDRQMKLPPDKRRAFMKTANNPADAVKAGTVEFNQLISLAGGLDKVKEMLSAADNAVETLANAPAPVAPVVAAPAKPKQTRKSGTKKVTVSDELKAEIENPTGNE